MSPAEKGSRPRGDKSGPAREPSALGVALDFLRLLWAVDHGLQRRSKRMESELGVTGMQRIIIRLIGRYPEVAAGRLADLVHVHPSTLTGVLRRLVDRGFVQRERDPADARRTKFSLLPPGEAIDATQAGTVEAAVRRALARMPPESIDAARAVLAVLAEELGRSDR
ncbi:MAG: MarR family transcriptional regulator [Labilithrix sp.]|nr:MarR family transcriptional regulator [Labilithrix sp.]